MRALPKFLLTAALALPTLVACDKAKDEPKKDDKAKTEEKKDEKADAKKAGEEVSMASPAGQEDPEAGCIHGEHKPKDGESCEHGAGEMPARDAAGHFGAEFAVSESQPLATVLANQTLPESAVKVTGTVEAVCQAKGCWMVIKDGDMQARVLVKDHAFAIPMDGKGKAATVEGTLTSKELTEANVAHLKKDGDDTIAGDGPRKEFFLEATAVELTSNS
jgi:hypothetical protein